MGMDQPEDRVRSFGMAEKSPLQAVLLISDPISMIATLFHDPPHQDTIS